MIISVINYKGGVGKTTLSANIAAELANRGNKVLLLDLDPQASLTLSFISVSEWEGLEKQERTIKHWYDKFLDHNMDLPLRKLIITPFKVNEQIRRNSIEGRLDLISSHLDLINIDVELSGKMNGETERGFKNNYLKVLSRLSMKLKEIEDEYNIIIIDCPPNFNIITQNALVASNYYIVPARADHLSTLGIETLIRHINRLQTKYNLFIEETERINLARISPQMLGVVFTMMTYRNQQPTCIQKDYIQRVKRHNNVFEYHLRENRSLYADAPQDGIPVALKKGTNQQIKEEIENLVSEVMKQTKILY